jgi:hypothetical protein
MNFSLTRKVFVKSKQQNISKKISLGKFSIIELLANQITLDPKIIRKTMGALEDRKASLGLRFDERRSISLPVNPDVALQMLQVGPPMVIPINDAGDCFALAANYWEFELIKICLASNPHEKLHCLLCPKNSADELANIYAAKQFASHYAAANTYTQAWDAGLFHDCFAKRLTDPQFAHFLRMTIQDFRDMRASQNRAKGQLNG